MHLFNLLGQCRRVDRFERGTDDLKLIGRRHPSASRAHIESEKSAHEGKLVQLLALTSHHERKEPAQSD